MHFSLMAAEKHRSVVEKAWDFTQDLSGAGVFRCAQDDTSKQEQEQRQDQQPHP
jgi:hypothetical protein